MNRSIWKGPYIKKKIYCSNTLINKNVIQISRNVIITPNFVNFNFIIHNGKNLLKIKVTENMVGYKFGEFCITRKKFSYKKKK